MAKVIAYKISSTYFKHVAENWLLEGVLQAMKLWGDKPKTAMPKSALLPALLPDLATNVSKIGNVLSSSINVDISHDNWLKSF